MRSCQLMLRSCQLMLRSCQLMLRSCQLMLQLSTCWSTCSVSVGLWPLYTDLKLSSDWLSYFVRSLAALPADSWKVTPTSDKDHSIHPVRTPRCHGNLSREGNKSRSDGGMLLLWRYHFSSYFLRSIFYVTLVYINICGKIRS